MEVGLRPCLDQVKCPGPEPVRPLFNLSTSNNDTFKLEFHIPSCFGFGVRTESQLKLALWIQTFDSTQQQALSVSAILGQRWDFAISPFARKYWLSGWNNEKWYDCEWGEAIWDDSSGSLAQSSWICADLDEFEQWAVTQRVQDAWVSWEFDVCLQKDLKQCYDELSLTSHHNNEINQVSGITALFSEAN